MFLIGMALNSFIIHTVLVKIGYTRMVILCASLYRLSASEGSPVDDIDLIKTLEASKIKSQEIKV